MILSLLILLALTTAGSCLADCQAQEELDWTSYGYFQSCRSKHIKQALQVSGGGSLLTKFIIKLSKKDSDFLAHMSVRIVAI